MSEWWTYRPTDFLMFSPTIYWRLFEAMNRAWWPAQPVLLLAGLAWLGVLARRPTGFAAATVRAAAAALAMCWLLVAWAFMIQRFEPIQWLAGVQAWAFFAQAGALAVLALFGGAGLAVGRTRRWLGLALGAWALLGHPLLTLAFGRPWQQAEVFGLAPDPTAIATLAFLLLVRAPGAAGRRLLGALWLVPVSWCLVSAATLLTMGAGQGVVMLAAAIVALLAVLARPARG